MRPTDATLIERCLAGDSRSWNELVERYGRLVYSVPRRYGLSDSDSEDVFQHVFISLYRALEQVRDTNRLSSWLITTAHRETWRIGKKSSRYPYLDEQIHDVSAPEEEDAETWERQDAVRTALVELGGTCEALLRALFMEKDDPSYEAIAERLGMKIGSIGPTRARCFSKLEAILVRYGITGWP